MTIQKLFRFFLYVEIEPVYIFKFAIYVQFVYPYHDLLIDSIAIAINIVMCSFVKAIMWDKMFL